MTPLIKEMVRHTDNAESVMWFDSGHMPSGTVEWNMDGQQLTHLPFPKMAIVGREARGQKFMLLLLGGDKTVTVAGMIEDEVGFRSIDGFAYADTDEGLRLMPAREGQRHPTKDDCRAILAIISTTMAGLESGWTAHQCVKRTNSLINRLREKKGECPLIYDWRTVIVAPHPKRAAAGGTHASPRHHDRRGHWRMIAGERRVWVKNCKVGNAANGTIFHDYKINGNTK